MPHVIVNLGRVRAEEQKQQLADAITEDVMNALNYGEDAVSVAMEEASPVEWTEKVNMADIASEAVKLYKRPGYNPLK